MISLLLALALGQCASTGTPGALAPGCATEVGTVDAAGRLRAVSPSNPLPVTGSITSSSSDPSSVTTVGSPPTKLDVIGVVDASGNATTVRTSSTLADGLRPQAALPVDAFGYYWDVGGSNAWNRILGTAGNGVLVDVSRIQNSVAVTANTNTFSAVVSGLTSNAAIDTGTCYSVGTGAAVRLATAGSGRHTAIIANRGTDDVYVNLAAGASSSNPPLPPGATLTVGGVNAYTGVIDALAASGTQSVCVYSY